MIDQIRIDYTTMHGAGNGFVLIDNRDQLLTAEECSRLAVLLCHREDTDGFIALFPDEEADFSMLFINRDGNLGEMCGNGARCVSRYAFDHGISRDPGCIRFRATAGMITARRITEEQYEVRLNDPSELDLHRSVEVCGKVWDCAYVLQGHPGIPHAVVEVSGTLLSDRGTLREIGRELRWSPAFPKGANVTFVEVTGRDILNAVTYERGVEDFTLACGTGCGATASALILRNRIPNGPVEVTVPGGQIRVRLSRCGDTVSDVFITGPTAYVSTGSYP